MRTTLAALRARMEEGLEPDEESMHTPDAPLPLIFRRHRDALDTDASDDSYRATAGEDFPYSDDEPEVDAFFDDEFIEDESIEDESFEDDVSDGQPAEDTYQEKTNGSTVRVEQKSTLSP